jgi:hypothetical protein
MTTGRTPYPRALLGVLAGASFLAVAAAAAAAESSAPARVASARDEALTESERRSLVSWVLAHPEIRAQAAGHRTRVLRVWSDVAKEEGGVLRIVDVVLLRDYDAGIAREITVDRSKGRIRTRELVGVQPSREEIEEGMAIVRRDPALARFVENPRLQLIGGFHKRSTHPNDPCAVDVCLDFAFMKPNYEGPERYVIVNLTRGVVAHHDFRGARPGVPPPPMTERSGE